MSKFKVGDRVRVKRTGKIGTITRADDWRTYPYKIAEDQGNEPFGENELEQFETRREFFVIHRDGNTMTAEHRVNREIIKSAKATCNPSDTFDFDTGAKLAFDRLMGRKKQNGTSPADIFFALTGRPAPEPPKYYTGKVFAVDANPCWQKNIEIVRRNGHVIEIKSGHIVGNNCGIDAFKEPYESFDDFCEKNFSTTWREVKSDV